MNVKLVDINKIKPYKNNPRHNDEAVEYVKNSIESFGMKVPIVVDKNYEIVTGHTRYKACKELGMDKIPTIMADDLDEEQVKAFRLADNKVAEKASWDYSLLDLELDDITEFDMGDFGFDLNIYEEDEDSKENERVRTVDGYNLSEYDEEDVEGFYQMPVIKAEMYEPDDLIGFNYMLSSEEFDKCVHFYIDDYQFERIWNDPYRYIEKLSKYRACLTPDFSLYLDMPMAMKIWNVYRSRLIGQMCQKMGITVIPTVSWAEKETFAFCFDGLPKNATLSISTIGVKREKESFNVWKAGVDEMISRLKPRMILVYGGEVEYDYGDIKVVYYNNHVTDRMKESNKNEI